MADPRSDEVLIMGDDRDDRGRKADRGAAKGKKNRIVSSLKDLEGDLTHHMTKIESFVTDVQGSVDDLTQSVKGVNAE